MKHTVYKSIKYLIYIYIYIYIYTYKYKYVCEYILYIIVVISRLKKFRYFIAI